MVIKIFYVAVAIFAVAMVFLSLQSPFSDDFIKSGITSPATEFKNVVDYEVGDKINGKFTSTNGVSYKNSDEFENFKAIYIDDINHTLSSKIAISKGDDIIFKKDVNYTNSNNLNFLSEEAIYNTKTKIAKSNVPFIMLQNGDKITGKSLKYDLNKKQTFSKGVHGCFQKK